MRVFLDLFQIQKNYNMAIYTSNHLGKWHWLKYDSNILLIEEFSSEIARSVNHKNLIQGSAGVHVVSVNGITETCSLSSDVLLEIPQAKNYANSKTPIPITPPYYPLYKDIFDLLITDFATVKANLDRQSYMTTRNLLTSASISISNNVRCTLNYNCLFDQMFSKIQFADYFPQINDFLARTAKNYDCRFFATNGFDETYKILSGNININVAYQKVYLLNLESEYPLYSPQSYEVTGTIVIPAKNWYDLANLYKSEVVKRTNISLLVGNRYLRLGQTIIEDNVRLSMGDNMMTAEISFKGFARL